MKKTIIFFIAGLCVLTCAFSISSNAFADTVSTTTRATSVLSDFVSANPDRTGGSDGESAAAEYLYNYLADLGYTVSYQEFQYRSDYTDKVLTSRNVVATKAASGNSDKQVIIGAHYDNTAKLDVGNGEIGGEGAGEATGVATVLRLAEELQAEVLTYNVQFVFFGSEESGLYGSKYYVSKMTEHQIESTLLMINLDSVGVGDNLYLYADEVKTIYEDYFLKLATDNSLDITPSPADKKLMLNYVPFADFNLLPYMHIGLMGDNSVFLNAGINTVSLFGYNWAKSRESLNYDNILDTNADTLENYLAYYGESGNQKMETAVSLIFTALTSEDFEDSMTVANEQKPNYSFWVNGIASRIILAVLFAAAILLVWLYYKKLDVIQKNSKKSEDTIKKEKVKVFEDF
jgi:hypothetical protein